MKYRYKTAKFVIPVILLIILILLAIIGNISIVSEYFYARGVSRWINVVLSGISNLTKICIYEWALLLAISIILGIIIFTVILLIKRNKRLLKKLYYVLFLIVLAIATLYVTAMGGIYNRYGIEKGLGINRAEVTDEKILAATELYIGKLNYTDTQLIRDEEGNMIPEESDKESLLPLIFEGYNSINKNKYLSKIEVIPKNVIMSDVMSHFGIIGITMPITGEICINNNVMAMELPCLIAHEIAHSKGVMRENEANVLSYLVCLRGNTFMKYSAYLNITLDLLNEIRRVMPSEYEKLYNSISENIRDEISNMYKNYRKYDSFINDIGNFFNNIYLKINGIQDGVASYGRTVGFLIELAEIS